MKAARQADRLFEFDHLAGAQLLAHPYLIQIGSRSDGLAQLVSAIPSQPVFARRQRPRPHLAHKLSQEVVDAYIYSLGTVGHRQGDGRGRIKRIGIVRTQEKGRRRSLLNGYGCGRTALVDKDESPARNPPSP